MCLMGIPTTTIATNCPKNITPRSLLKGSRPLITSTKEVAFNPSRYIKLNPREIKHSAKKYKVTPVK